MTLQEEVARRIAGDPLLARLRRKIDGKNADFKDTAAYSNRAADIMSEIFARRLPELSLAEREALCVELLRDRHTDINELLSRVQLALDDAAGIHIAPQHAPFNSERAHQIGRSTADPTVSEETQQRRARSAPATAARAMHDDYIRKNADFRNRAGLKCYINREAVPACCAWCTAMAGRFEYGEEPDDIYRRHDNCSCTVTFENGRKRQDVWSKREWEAPEEGAGAGEPVVLTEEQAETLQEKHGLTNPAENGTIQQGPSLRISMQFFAHRNSEDMPTIRLPKQEYAHVMSEIASHLTDDDKTSPVFVKRIGNYQYTVENHGFGDYRIIAKRRIKNG